MSIYAKAEHGIVCSVDEGAEKYFGWPSVAKLSDGTIVAGASGLRRAHVCPWGKSTVCYSKDGGKTFTAPEVVHDDLIDNRDLGVIALGGQSYAITWFSLDIRTYGEKLFKWLPEKDGKDAFDYMATWNDYTVKALQGSWTKITNDGGKTWTRPIRVPVSAPHGFTKMADGTLGYLGKGYREDIGGPGGRVQYCVSRDGGFTWQIMGTVPMIEGDTNEQYHEPHVIDLKDGTLMGVIRFHYPKEQGGNLDTCLTFSKDGGCTWTVPEHMKVEGAPAQLMRHSSGAIIMTYGYRHPGYGQRAKVTYDEGKTWSDEIIIRDDGDTGDLGYPCSIELDDGKIYTVYYQAKHGRENTCIMWSKWELPEIK